MKNFDPFKSIHFIEILFSMPWKPILSLIVLTYIAAMYDLISSIWTDESNDSSHLNDVFSTLLNTNNFLLWVFFIAYISYILLSFICSYRMYKNKPISSKFSILVKIFGYTGFFIVEIFYLIGFFCLALLSLALIFFDFQSLISFFMFSFIFVGIAIGSHWMYLSAKVNKF